MDGGDYAEIFFDEAIEDDEKVNRPVESGVGAADVSYCYDENGYVSDWLEIATRIKIARHRRCEKCRFSSFSNSIIHVHYINKDKTNNELSNLKVLCAFCHGAAHGTVPLGKMSSADRAELMAWRSPTKAKVLPSQRNNTAVSKTSKKTASPRLANQQPHLSTGSGWLRFA